ncbi:MAG: hypothetical protein JW891_04780 [Candidatus Lokiarchaeota archaeon]|nr:hypothetical protein [Candidatus Lokiarchaeota archaeon]
MDIYLSSELPICDSFLNLIGIHLSFLSSQGIQVHYEHHEGEIGIQDDIIVYK